MTLGTLTLRRFNGIETYDLISANMMLYDTDYGQCLNLEIQADKNGSKTTTDTTDESIAPNAEVSIYRESFNLSALAGQRFTVESAYDDEMDDYLSRFYYYEHEDIDNNVIDFLEQDAQGRYCIRWSGETADPNYYDGSKPATIMEIDAKFTLKSNSCSSQG